MPRYTSAAFSAFAAEESISLNVTRRDIIENPYSKYSNLIVTLPLPADQEPVHTRELRGIQVNTYHLPSYPKDPPSVISTTPLGRELLEHIESEEGIKWLLSTEDGSWWCRDYHPLGSILVNLPVGLQTKAIAVDHISALRPDRELFDLPIDTPFIDLLEHLERTWEGQAYLCWLVNYPPFCELYYGSPQDQYKLKDCFIGSLFVTEKARSEVWSQYTFAEVSIPRRLRYTVPEYLIPDSRGPFYRILPDDIPEGYTSLSL